VPVRPYNHPLTEKSPARQGRSPSRPQAGHMSCPDSMASCTAASSLATRSRSGGVSMSSSSAGVARLDKPRGRGKVWIPAQQLASAHVSLKAEKCVCQVAREDHRGSLACPATQGAPHRRGARQTRRAGPRRSRQRAVAGRPAQRGSPTRLPSASMPARSVSLCSAPAGFTQSTCLASHTARTRSHLVETTTSRRCENQAVQRVRDHRAATQRLHELLPAKSAWPRRLP
jgi:hypothetical protein